MFSWLFEPLEKKTVSKCPNCGAEIREENYACATCGYVITTKGLVAEQRESQASSDISMAPDIPDTLHDEACSLWVAGQHAEALEVFKRALALDPNRADVWYEKALHECKCGLLEDAIASLQKACELDSSYANIADITDSRDFQALRTDTRFRELVRKRREELRRIPRQYTILEDLLNTRRRYWDA
jgi:tetratricopeptide (TPR) repeat protein